MRKILSYIVLCFIALFISSCCEFPDSPLENYTFYNNSSDVVYTLEYESDYSDDIPKYVFNSNKINKVLPHNVYNLSMSVPETTLRKNSLYNIIIIKEQVYEQYEIKYVIKEKMYERCSFTYDDLRSKGYRIVYPQ